MTDGLTKLGEAARRARASAAPASGRLMAAFARKPVPQQWAQSESYLPVSQPGLLEPGNINLFNRPNVRNPDGSVSTVHSLSYGDDTGETVIPTVSDEGVMMEPDDAIRYWAQRKQHLGKFATPEEAEAFAEALHQQQASFYGLK